MLEQVVWAEKYRPNNIDECILPKVIKSKFQQIASDGNIPNLLLSGRPGIGKTSVAKALLNQLDVDYITINGSLNGNIDTLRNDIQNFASTVSMIDGARKMVILDEADYLNAGSTQPALRNFMEEYSSNCGFILTCNYRNRIIEPIQDRCSLVEFIVPSEERTALVKEAVSRIFQILDKENVKYDRKVVAQVVLTYYPSIRKTLNEIQAYAKTGQIDAGILASKTTKLDELVKFLKEKDFRHMRSWVAENADMDFHMFLTELMPVVEKVIEPSSIPQIILIVNEYDYKNSFVGNKEINTVAMLTEIMRDCNFK